MIKLFEFLVSGCWHNWEVVERFRLTDKGITVGDRFLYKCSKCGMHKKKDF